MTILLPLKFQFIIRWDWQCWGLSYTIWYDFPKFFSTSFMLGPLTILLDNYGV